MLNIRSRGLVVHNTDILWNKLIKFSKQIGNSLGKKIQRRIQNPAKQLR